MATTSSSARPITGRSPNSTPRARHENLPLARDHQEGGGQQTQQQQNGAGDGGNGGGGVASSLDILFSCKLHPRPLRRLDPLSTR
jgi:hypothetical protein